MRLLAALALAPPGGAAAQESLGQLARARGWYADYEPARAAARQNGKPLLVVFRCEP